MTWLADHWWLFLLAIGLIITFAAARTPRRRSRPVPRHGPAARLLAMHDLEEGMRRVEEQQDGSDEEAS